ncbi:hypothetical protein [Saccharomonospora cyanea]|uniref:Transaldolase n=1 Tax=Saccharomonospora cyanea NA-134 TaxID=882082 RepID=H5XJK0_9PSEU|nr:hypothetical protein SaccyDRAFT_0827 [Saccharomonospora cyanea NA-134]
MRGPELRLDVGGTGAEVTAAVSAAGTERSPIPRFARLLCDDAAMFPPGLAPLPEAVPAHVRHTSAPYGELVGPLVVAASVLDELTPLLPVGGDPVELVVTLPEGPARVRDVLAGVADLPVRLRALEVAVPESMAATELLTSLDGAAVGESVEVFVEVPRDARRAGLITALAATRYLAKFRTGGVRAELYPDVTELAEAVSAVVAAGVPFKATAGLHHAIRNTDPDTGFEQHGFLNLLLATHVAAQGADAGELAGVLADTDGEAVAERVRALDDAEVEAARTRFRSFGTCSITDPLHDLIGLGLLPPSLTENERTV